MGQDEKTILDSNDTVSEWLRRWTRNPLGSAREGSNPFGVAFSSCVATWTLVAESSGRVQATCNTTVWPSGLRRQTQVLVEQSAWVRTPQLSDFVGAASQRRAHLQSERRPPQVSLGSLAERSKALASGASPKGREFESRSCHFHSRPAMPKKLRCQNTKPMAGFEPTTSRLLSGCSTAKLHWRYCSCKLTPVCSLSQVRHIVAPSQLVQGTRGIRSRRRPQRVSVQLLSNHSAR